MAVVKAGWKVLDLAWKTVVQILKEMYWEWKRALHLVDLMETQR